jgi:hypothetical protein
LFAQHQDTARLNLGLVQLAQCMARVNSAAAEAGDENMATLRLASKLESRSELVTDRIVAYVVDHIENLPRPVEVGVFVLLFCTLIWYFN